MLAAIVLLYKDIAYIMCEIIEILNMDTERDMRMKWIREYEKHNQVNDYLHHDDDKDQTYQPWC